MKSYKALLIIIFLIFANPKISTAQEKLNVVTTFSILEDMTQNIAGDKINLKNLVPPNSDAHAYEPTPKDVIDLQKADILIINGLGFETWVDRLIKASGFKGNLIVASKGVVPLTISKKGAATNSKQIDPHAWQDIKNGELYVTNIRDGLIESDNKNADAYNKNANEYLSQLKHLDSWTKNEINKLPPENRKVITPHDALEYFGHAYGIEFIAPLGISTESEVSAAGIAKLLDQVRAEKVHTVFLENISDSRLAKQLERDGGVHIGGTLYSDALSPPDGPAATYIKMFENNVSNITRE